MVYGLSDQELSKALQSWEISKPFKIFRLSGGLSAEVWKVETQNEVYIAKFAFDDQKAFETGLKVAEVVQKSGFASGAAIRTQDGTLTVIVEGPPGKHHPLALLSYVPGNPLNPQDKNSQKIAGKALGEIHTILLHQMQLLPNPERLFGYITEASEEVDHYPWLKQKIQETMGSIVNFEKNNATTYGICVGDEMEFLLDEKTGELGMVDWGAVGYGALLFDLACLHNKFLKAGISEIKELDTTYLYASPMKDSELIGLKYYLRLLWCRSAKSRVWRITHNVSFGDTTENTNKEELNKYKEKLLREL